MTLSERIAAARLAANVARGSWRCHSGAQCIAPTWATGEHGTLADAQYCNRRTFGPRLQFLPKDMTYSR